MQYQILNIKNALKKNEVTEVIISIQSIEPKRLLEITSYLFNLNLKVKF